ncbi:hypothetical protein Anas_00202 [Armadillidium nasatum]|uniref:Uncharacterized protein n=1 Tax=Armadillidium nasatum TaxID=96803 RepID=A0A5N5TLM0_9CRUS|nr:hypothetical protein Anas_00202 [Armadillidium nasatum]
MKAGIVMNILCVLVINIMINTLGVAMFNVYELPDWVSSADNANYTQQCVQNVSFLHIYFVIGALALRPSNKNR